MAILVNKETKILIQGITGRSGIQVTRELLSYGSKVVGGVTPGKGGQEVEGVPVFNSVREAIDSIGILDVSMTYVPPLMARDAALEVIENGVPLVEIFVEKMPILDVSQVLFAAKKKGVRVLGPASVGAISPGEAKIGSIGGPSPDKVFTKGPVGVISKSGGMTSELSMLITNTGYGQSTAVGIGGDLLIGTSFSDLLLDFEEDKQTKVVVAFGEVGGRAEIDAANLVKEGKIKKPFIVFMAGRFAESLPKDTSLGHAGAIVGLDFSMDEKMKILRESGVIVIENFEEIPAALKKVL